MDQPDAATQQPKPERRFDQEQYERLRRCSEKKDMSEWNEWRKAHFNEPVLLEGADLHFAHLADADLRAGCLDGANLFQSNLERVFLFAARLKGTTLMGACLKEGHLEKALLNGADLRSAHLEGADLSEACLECADLSDGHLASAILKDALLARTRLSRADLAGAYLYGTHLEQSDVQGADLRGTRIWNAHIEGMNANMSLVDAATLISDCAVDRDTDFSGVGLDSIRIDPGTKQLLEYNIRRKNWEKWYKEHRFLRWPVWMFWGVSDYGLATGRILGVFFGLALAFASIYWLWGMVNPPGIIENLFEEVLPNGEVRHPDWVPLRALCFLVTTMTTLGFGDIHADIRSWVGHVLVTLQVLSGYVLLGAIVTRLNILFTAGGPAGKFAPSPRKKDEG